MVLQIICCCCAWSLILFCIWRACPVTLRGKNYLKTLHQIPCSRCTFFTNDYRLKCTVNPYDAGTESAINCRDFEPKSELITQSPCHSCHRKSFNESSVSQEAQPLT